MTGTEREKHRVRQQIEIQTDGKGKEGMPLEKVEMIKKIYPGYKRSFVVIAKRTVTFTPLK